MGRNAKRENVPAILTIQIVYQKKMEREKSVSHDRSKRKVRKHETYLPNSCETNKNRESVVFRLKGADMKSVPSPIRGVTPR